MKQFFFVICLLLFVSLTNNAQQPHFVYLQTDNNQPFYVLLKNKNYSSSSFGYVILPKLENGDYRIKVGFAKSDMPEQDYLLKVKDNDQGYLIKNFGEKGSGLFNLQTLAVQYSGEMAKQLDAVANAQREAEKQKVLLQQQKDSTTKAEAALAEQRKAENEARLAAAAAKQKEDAVVLAKQQTEDSIKAVAQLKTAAVNQKKEAAILARQQAADSIKAVTAAKQTLAKQKKEAAALAKQQSLDSVKTVNANKIAAARQNAFAKHEADSFATAANPIAKTLPKAAETPAQKKIRLNIEAVRKHQADSLEKERILLVQQQTSDSIKAAEQAKIAAVEQQKKDEELALAKQKADEKAEIEAQKRAYDMAQQRKIDSLAMIEKNRLQAEKTAAIGNQKVDSSLLMAKPTTERPTSKNVNATIVYEPVVLSRTATDSGTIMTYKIPSNKGWDTVTAFIKAPLSEQKSFAPEKTAAVENNTPAKSDGVKFLDIHFKQDSADKSNDMITPVFKENKPAEKVVAADNTPVVKIKPVSTEPVEAPKQVANSNCRAEANDKDFYSLRKKMVAQNDADNMIMVAKKSMREKCYTTLQIRNLSFLLITDADRYQFLEAAYPFASDAYNYKSLADLLKDSYYGDRFKVMLKR